MISFLRSSKKIAREVSILVLESEQAKKDVQKGKINEAIEKLKDISSEELYQTLKHNTEGLAQEVIEEEVGKTIKITQRIIELLKKNNTEEALGWLNLLIDKEINIQKWIDHKIAVRNHAHKLAKNIKRILKKYVRNGMVVVELFNGERSDILEALAELVGESGHVYGIDKLNPFEMYEDMVVLNSLPNVDLIQASFPSIPVPKSDIIVVREFCYVTQTGNKNAGYSILDSKLRRGGSIILFLNHTEYHEELEIQSYQRAISQFPSNYKLIEFNELELVFQKQ